MKLETLGRLGAGLAAAWTGAMLAIGGVAAPLLFAALPLPDAGRLAARLFATEATVGVCVAALMVVIALQVGRQRADRFGGSRFGAELVLSLAALLCLLLGYYAVLPMMEAARAGQGAVSFAVLHLVSGSAFALRALLAAALAWRFQAAGR